MDAVFAQTDFKASYGVINTLNKSISVEEFNNQKELITSPNYFIDSVVVYFSIPGEHTGGAIHYWPILDSIKFNKYRALLSPGSSVIFSIKATENSRLKKINYDLSYVIYGYKPRTIEDSIHIIELENKVKTLKTYRDLHYISGSIHFKITGQKNIISVFIRNGDVTEFHKIFDMINIGSALYFEQVKYLDNENKLRILNMTYKFE